jgi:hypothetical protein
MTDMTTGSYRRSHDPEGGSLTVSCTISVLLGPFHRKWRQQTSRHPEGIPLKGWDVRMCNRKLRNIRPSGPFHWKWRHQGSLANVGCSHAQPEVGGFSLLESFDRKWRHQTSPVGLPLEVTWPEVSLGCSLGHLVITLSISSPFTGYLPLSRHFHGERFQYRFSPTVFSDMFNMYSK